MSRSYRLPDAPVVGVVLAVIVALILAALINQHNEAQRHERATTEEYEKSKWFPPYPTTAQRQRPDPKAYREEWRAERDLLAQRQMAKWAFWLLIVTAFGVGLLILTFWETKRAAQAAFQMVKESKKATAAANRAADETKRVGEAQVRAFLTFDKVVLKLKNHPEIHFVISNSGNSPARNVEVYLEARWDWDRTPNLEGLTVRSGSQIGTIRQGAVEPTTGMVYFATTFSDEEMSRLGKGVFRIMARLTIR